MVSSRRSASCGSRPSFRRRTSARSSAAFPRMPVNGLFSSCRRTSPKSSSTSGEVWWALLWEACATADSCSVKSRSRRSTRLQATGRNSPARATKSAAPVARSPPIWDCRSAVATTTSGASAARRAATSRACAPVGTSLPGRKSPVSSSTMISGGTTAAKSRASSAEPLVSTRTASLSSSFAHAAENAGSRLTSKT